MWRRMHTPSLVEVGRRHAGTMVTAFPTVLSLTTLRFNTLRFTLSKRQASDTGQRSLVASTQEAITSGPPLGQWGVPLKPADLTQVGDTPCTPSLRHFLPSFLKLQSMGHRGIWAPQRR